MARFGVRRRSAQWYGWTPDLPDHRDHLFVAGRKSRLMPKSVDLRSTCSPIENQGQLGSCTANALAGALQFLEVKDGKSPIDLSRLFIYYNERLIEGTIGQDAGAMIRDGIKTLAAQGVCAESAWPYKPKQFAVKPSAECYLLAKAHKIKTYTRLQSLADMRSCLAAGYPFVFGFTAYESFESPTIAQTGVLDMPRAGEATVGGHAVCCVGYDDASQRFLVRNSWGARWGIAGYFTMPYAYLEDRNLSDDFWTIRRGGGL